MPAEVGHNRPNPFGQGRLGHANIAFTIETYQHVMPGMHADAARVYEQLARPVPPAEIDPVERRRNSRRNTA